MSPISAVCKSARRWRSHGTRFQGRVWKVRWARFLPRSSSRLNRNIGEATCIIDNPDLRLLPNVNVGVTIVVAEQSDALTLQRDAVHVDDSKPYVFRIVNGHLKQQSITISLQNLTRVAITSGLNEGDSVALTAEDTKPLIDGAAVKVIP